MFTKIEKLAKRLRKETKGKIDVHSITNYISKLGYKIIFFNTEQGDMFVSLYGLNDVIKETNAFTVTGEEKIIFIDGSIHMHDQLYLLLHELAHILLGHIGDGNVSLKDKQYIEAEADSFVYAVMSDNRNKTLSKCIAAFCSAFLFFGIGVYIGSTYSSTYEIDNTSTKNVIITRTGESYHCEGCISINNKDYILIPHKEAEKIYAPCKICNPK